MFNRKTFTFSLMLLFAVCAWSQQTKLNTNWDTHYSQGIKLSREGYYAVSCTYLERFINENRGRIQENAKETGNGFVNYAPSEMNSMLEEAEYWLCYNHYMMKDREAIDRINAHLARYPESSRKGQLMYMRGRWYYEKRKWEEAVKAYAECDAKVLNYDDREVFIFSNAYSQLQLNQYEKASKGFKESMSTSRHYYNEAAYYYAYSEFCMQHYDTAIDIFHRIDDDSKFKEAAEFHILQIYDSKGQRTAAVEKGKELITNYPKSQYTNEAYRIIGENAYRTQNYKEASTALYNYTRATKEPHRADIYMQGISEYQIADYKNSISILGRLTSDSDSLAMNAYLFIGYGYLQMNQPQNARLAFKQASTIGNNEKVHEEAAYNYAIATFESRAPFGESIKAFSDFNKRYPTSSHKAAILELTAEAYIAERDYAAAVEAIDKMDYTNDNLRQAKETALFRLGVAAMEDRNYDKAIEYMSQSIAMNNAKSMSSQAYLWRAECSYKQGKMKDAQEDIKRYLATPQKKTSDCLQKAYYTLAYTYWEEKNYRMARPYFSKFNEIKGSDKSTLYSDVTCRIGDCYYNNRDFENALNTYWSVPTKDANADYSLYQIAQIYGLQHKYNDKIDALNMLLARHPNSDWHDEAMYEIGRTYVLQEKNTDAIASYLALQKKHPMSKWTRKATLEIAMLNANMGNYEGAIEAYKYVVDKYPSSEEARVSLESMQGLYVEINKVDDYISYRQSVAGITVQTVNINEEDSLQFLAAEKCYMKNDWNQAISSLNNYLVKYCNELSFNCITAQYYLAESYYNIGNKQQAMIRYHKLTTMDGNEYMEASLLKAAEIAYDREEYASANSYFNKLMLVATTSENRATARLGILRCSFYTNLYDQTIRIADDIMSLGNASPELQREARYNRAKSYIALNLPDSAVDDLMELSREPQTKAGAESNYLYSQYLYDKGLYQLSENQIMMFIEAGTPYQYWVARCMLLLSDINRAREDNVMARMYLESLREGYTEQDDIQTMLEQRMNELK